MGDRTNAIIRFPLPFMDKELRQEAIRILCENSGLSERDLNEDDLKELPLEDVNEGAREIVNDLCNSGIPFHVQWGAGDEYDAGCTVSNGKEERHVLWDRHGGGILIKLDPDGNPDRNAIDNAKAFLAMKKGIGL